MRTLQSALLLLFSLPLLADDSFSCLVQANLAERIVARKIAFLADGGVAVGHHRGVAVHYPGGRTLDYPLPDPVTAIARLPDGLVALTPREMLVLATSPRLSLQASAETGGNLLAALGETVLVGRGATLELWRLGSGAPERRASLTMMSPLTSLAILDEGNGVAATAGGAVRKVAWSGSELRLDGELSLLADRLAFDGSTLYAATNDHLALLSPTGETLGRISLPLFVEDLTASAGVFAVTDRNGRAVIGTKEEIRQVAASGVTALALAPDRMALAGPRPLLEIFRRTGLHLDPIERLEREGSELGSIAFDGHHLIVADAPHVRFFDVRDPLRPAEIAAIDVGGDFTNVKTFGRLAAAFGKGTAYLIDLSLPDMPRQVGLYVSGAAAGSDLFVDGDLLYQASPHVGFHAVDVSDPARPRQIGGLMHGGFGIFGQAVVAHAGYVYAGAGNSAVVIDVRNPSAPSVATHFTGESVAMAIVRGRDDLLVVAERFRLRLFSLADPSTPREVATVTSDSPVRSISVRDGTLSVLSEERLTRWSVASGSFLELGGTRVEGARHVAVTTGGVAVAFPSHVALADTGGTRASPGAPSLRAVRRRSEVVLTWRREATAYEVEQASSTDFSAPLRWTTGETSVTVSRTEGRFVRVRATDGCTGGEWSHPADLGN